MTIGIIIFSRYNSQRLPGKALLDIRGRALLGRVLDRVKEVKGNYKIVIATSNLVTDDPIAQFAQEEQCDVFRGNLDDVAQRAYDCCCHYNFDAFVRVCGDRPFMDTKTVERLITLQQNDNIDLATNALKKTYPSGLMAEVVKTSALQQVLENTGDKEDREHVTRYIYNNRNQFTIKNIEAEEQKYKNLSLAIDDKEDVTRAEWIIEHIEKTENADIKIILELTEKWEQSHRRGQFSG